MNQDISYPYPISAPIPNATHSHYTEKSRLSLLRSSDDEPISDTDQHHHLHQASQPNSHSEKGKIKAILQRTLEYTSSFVVLKPMSPDFVSRHFIRANYWDNISRFTKK